MRRPVLRADLLGMSMSGLRELNPALVLDTLDSDVIAHMLRECDALWQHNGDPGRPHAELTSGQCSDGFVDVLRMLRYTNLCELAARHLVLRLLSTYSGDIDWVVGSDHAGATLSFEIARHLGAQHDFAEKGPDKTQIWKRFEIRPSEVVLQVEELITTAGTLQAVRHGIAEAHPDSTVRYAPVVVTLVNRSGLQVVGGQRVVEGLALDIQTWDPSDCPLCSQGSQRLRPKEHWVSLTGRA